MGVQSSYQDTKSALSVLADIEQTHYVNILAKLDQRNKDFQMQLSKWELVLLLELNPAQTK